MEKEINRLMSMLKTLDPTTDEYCKVLSNLYNLYNLKRDVDRWTGGDEPIQWAEEQQVEEVKEEVVEQVKESIAEPVITDEVIIEKAEYTKEEVRDLLLKVREKGIKVEPIVEAFTPEGKTAKFSSIPASKYSELVEELKKYA